MIGKDQERAYRGGDREAETGDQVDVRGATREKTWRCQEADIQCIFYPIKCVARFRSSVRAAKKVMFKLGRTPKSSQA